MWLYTFFDQGSWSNRTRGYTEQLGSTASMLLCLGRTVEWAPQSACSLAKDSNQASYELPCQIGLPNLPLQMDRATGCSLCLGTTVSRNVVPQDLSTGCCEPIPFSVSSVSPWLSSTDFPSDPCAGVPDRKVLRKDPCAPLFLHPRLSEPRLCEKGVLSKHMKRTMGRFLPFRKH